MVVELSRRLRSLPRRRFGGRPREAARARSGRLLAQGRRAPGVRFVLAGSGDGQGAGGVSGHGADDAGPQPVGSGGHLWGDGGLEGAQGQRSGRQSPSRDRALVRSEEHTSELQSLMLTSYAVFCLLKKNL